MAASKALLETISWSSRMPRAQKDRILQASSDDILVQVVLDDDWEKHPNEWPAPLESESDSEYDWSREVFYNGINWSVERHPRSLEQALMWRDLERKVKAIRRVCSLYYDVDPTSLANVFLVTTCFALGRPLMPQNSVVRFLRDWANVTFDTPLPFSERSRSGLPDSLAGKPPQTPVPFDNPHSKKPFSPNFLKEETGKMPAATCGDSEGLRSDVSRAQPAPQVTFTAVNSRTVSLHTHSCSQFSPVSSKATGYGKFYQSFPQPFLGPVLERIIENHLKQAYGQVDLMDTYMRIMRHPDIPKARHVGRQLFNRISEIQTSIISPSLVVEDLLSSLGIHPNLHLRFDFTAMQELLRSPDPEAPSSPSVNTMRIVVDLIHSNVENGYLLAEDALGFFKRRALCEEMPDTRVVDGLVELFHVPRSCYSHLQSSGSRLDQGTKFKKSDFKIKETDFKKPTQQSQKPKRPLRGESIFPMLQLSDSDPGSSSPEDGVTEDFWGLSMPSKKARELATMFNIGVMRDDIRSKTPRREASRKEKTKERRHILQKPESGDSLFALPGEDTKTFLKRNPPKKFSGNRRREREGTPVPDTGSSPSTTPTKVGFEIGPLDSADRSDHSTAESSTTTSVSNTEGSQTKDSPASPESSPTDDLTEVKIRALEAESDSEPQNIDRRPSESQPDPSIRSNTIIFATVASNLTDPSNYLITESSIALSASNIEAPQTKDSSISLRSTYTVESTNTEPAVNPDANKPDQPTQEMPEKAGQIGPKRKFSACLFPDQDPVFFLHPLPLSIHKQYNGASLRPTSANLDFDSYFQSPQATSPTINAALNKIFDTYRDDVEDKPDMIGIEGAMKYLGDIGVKLDEVACFAISELLQSPSMGEFTRSGFLAGWKSVNCETLKMQATHANSLRTRVINEPEFFRRVYRYTFPICRLAGQKILPLEIACEQWRLFFTSSNGGITWNSPSTPWLDWWIEYLENEWKRPINKDLWEQTEVLVRKTKEDENFEWWSAEGAWPGAIDDFVGWVKEKRGSTEAMEVE